MPKDIVVHIGIDAKPKPAEELNILLASTSAQMPYKTYWGLDELEKDFGKSTIVYQKASALFKQDSSKAKKLIDKISVVGFSLKGETEPLQAKDLITQLDELRKVYDDWYILLTDRADDAALKALCAWAETTEPTEAALGSGVEDYRKFYIGQTENLDLEITNRRCAIACHDNLDEHLDAAYLGNVGPHYPKKVTWKFKTPDGISLPDFSTTQRNKLEAKNFNFMTAEYKFMYMKNGVCCDGEFIDTQLGADYIAFSMRNMLYETALKNANIPYTDPGFTVIVDAVAAALNRAVDLHIIARDHESGKGLFKIRVPKRVEATDEQARARAMPPVYWSAQLEGSVHSTWIDGTLYATLPA